jgi:hypothetical protein
LADVVDSRPTKREIRHNFIREEAGGEGREAKVERQDVKRLQLSLRYRCAIVGESQCNRCEVAAVSLE